MPAQAPTRPDRGRVAPALAWSYLLSFSRFALGGALTFVLAAILDPHSIGVMFMAMVWVAFVLMLIHNATLPLLQQEDITDSHFNAAFWALLVGACAAAVLVTVTAPLIAAVNRTPELTPVARALAPLILLEAITAVPDAFLRRKLQFRTLAIRNLYAVVVGGAVGLGLAFAGYGVWALVGQQLATSLAYVVGLFVARPWTPRFAPLGAPLTQMRATSAKSIGGFLGEFLAKRSDALIIGILFGPVATGLYRLATRLTEMMVDLSSSALNQVGLPDLAVLFREPAAFAERLRLYAHTNAVIAFPLLGMVAATAGQILALLGPEWTPAAGAVRVLCLASAVSIASALLGTGLLAAQRPGVEAVSNWLQAAVSVTCIAIAAFVTRSMPLTVRLEAIAAAVFVTQVAMASLLWHLLFRRALKVSGVPLLRAVAPAALTGGVVALCGVALHDLALLAHLAPVADLALVGSISMAIAAMLLFAMDESLRVKVRGLLPNPNRPTASTAVASTSEGP